MAHRLLLASVAATVAGIIVACSDDTPSVAPTTVTTPSYDAGISSTPSIDASTTDETVDGSIEDAGVDAGPPQGCNDGVFTFDDDFSQGLRPAFWSVAESPTADAGIFTYSVDAGDLHFAKVGTNPGGLKNIGARLDLTAAGGPVLSDFSMEVDFRDAVLGATQIDQIELHAEFGDASIFYDVYSNEGGLELHVWDGAFRGRVQTSANLGKMRITRTGTTLSGYATTGGVETLIYSKEQPTTPELKVVDFVAQVYNTNNAIAVTFDDFHIRGACAKP